MEENVSEEVVLREGWSFREGFGCMEIGKRRFRRRWSWNHHLSCVCRVPLFWSVSVPTPVLVNRFQFLSGGGGGQCQSLHQFLSIDGVAGQCQSLHQLSIDGVGGGGQCQSQHQFLSTDGVGGLFPSCEQALVFICCCHHQIHHSCPKTKQKRAECYGGQELKTKAYLWTEKKGCVSFENILWGFLVGVLNDMLKDSRRDGLCPQWTDLPKLFNPFDPFIAKTVQLNGLSSYGHMWIDWLWKCVLVAFIY